LINQAALSVFHLSPKVSYEGRTLESLGELTPLIELYWQAVSLRQSLIQELVIPQTNRTYHASIVPAPDVGWSIVMHDVTPFKETEQLKNELVATASHDLKNPLSVMLGYLDLINMTNELNTQGMDYMRRAQRSISHMRDLIDDLLDMARIESGLALECGPIDVQWLVIKTVDELAIQAREKKMRVEIDIARDLPEVCADEQRLSQIMHNLLNNAIKYTPPEGRIWVRAGQRGSFVQFAIQDSGMGISPEDQAQVFQRFFRVRAPETDSIEGTGLGLAIVKSLVEAHGGQVGLESRLGEGSTFFFTIPVLPCPEEDEEKDEDTPANSRPAVSPAADDVASDSG
jgi:signal transduction histidine kinase